MERTYCIGLFTRLTLFIITLGLFCLPTAIHPELLVVKKVDGLFQPLDEADACHNAAIMDIILKYQWPQCLAAETELTEEEKEELFSSEPAAEEKLIEKKIQQAIGDQYHVVFIPTALYELFCIYEILKNFDQSKLQTSPIEKLVRKITKIKHDVFKEPDTWCINLSPALNNTTITPSEIEQEVKKIYRTVNHTFLQKESGLANPWFFMNSTIAQNLFNQCHSLHSEQNSVTLSDAIKNESLTLLHYACNQIHTLLEKSEQQGKFIPLSPWCSENLYLLIRHIAKTKFSIESNEPSDSSITNKVIQQTITLEYEGRTKNKAILFRGCGIKSEDVGLKHDRRLCLLGSTISHDYQTPYSISFGNSLFAGMLTDHHASSYYFLGGGRLTRRLNLGQTQQGENLGYALQINKMDYYENACDSLFFIAPTATLPALVQYGEYFHSRSVAATALKNNCSHFISGLFSGAIIDQTGIFLIEKNPLEHAASFSKCIANNGHLIFHGDEAKATFTKEQMVTNQTKAARFYHLLWGMQKIAHLGKTYPRIKAGMKKCIENARTEMSTEAPTADEPDAKRQKTS